ncbi:MAG TPA: hypothetical protein VG944_12820 [Fimbriimonas sp.]|nr:hypothetical protein [Fimbriimonas sp.]
MRTFLSLFGSAILAASAFSSQQPSRALFQRLEAEDVAATKSKNLAWYQKHYTPDFTAIDEKGVKETREQRLRNIQRVFQCLASATST